MSPSGSRFDDEPGGRPSPSGGRFQEPREDWAPREDRPSREDRQPREDRQAREDRQPREDRPLEDWRPRAAQSPAGRSPSGAPYSDEPSYSGPHSRPRSYEPYETAAPEPAPGRRGAARVPEAPDRDWDGPQPQGASAWPANDDGSWRQDDQGSGWVPSEPQRGWPQAEPQGWPQDPAQAYPEGASGAESDWSVPGQASWPEQGDALEALPGEVHHDWGGRGDRPQRGWIAPADETDGDTW
jgi:hypothetical protein